MSTQAPQLFPELFGRAPNLVREFLNSALQIRDLQTLYSTARERYPDLELSQKLLKVLNVELEITPEDLARFPASGPLLVVANHPFGILDGMLLDSVLLKTRPDIKILTNAMICGIEELQDRCLPIDVFGGTSALSKNVKSLRKVISILRSGNGIAFFPAGEVSHWQKEFRCITDPPWSDIAVRCSTLADVPILPVYFQGKNSLRFQVGGMIHPRLRTVQLPGELLNKRNRTVEVRVGSLIKPRDLRQFDSLEKATDYVRARTYMLGCRREPAARSPLPAWRKLPLFNGEVPLARKPISINLAQDHQATVGIYEELRRLEGEDKIVIQNDEFAVYLEHGDKIPQLIHETGRLRELTFRNAGEGTGKAVDLDNFDPYYRHLILWHKPSREIAGSYRLAWTTDVLPRFGVGGLYTSSLFRYQPAFFSKLGPAMELGRSFIRPEFQKEYAPLLLLWQAIARTTATRPEAPVLFGAVSISDEYSQASRELIVQFVSKHGFREDLRPYLTPRHPFRSKLSRGFNIDAIAQGLPDLEALSGPIGDAGDASGVPVLLRQYFKMGGRVVGFNIDPHFANALDCLLIVDLRETSPKMLDRYMGPQLGRQYRLQLQETFAFKQ